MQSRMIGLADNHVCTRVTKLIAMASIKGTGHYRQIGVMRSGMLYHLSSPAAIVYGNDQQARLGYARRMQ